MRCKSEQAPALTRNHHRSTGIHQWSPVVLWWWLFLFRFVRLLVDALHYNGKLRQLDGPCE